MLWLILWRLLLVEVALTEQMMRVDGEAALSIIVFVGRSRYLLDTVYDKEVQIGRAHV